VRLRPPSGRPRPAGEAPGSPPARSPPRRPPRLDLSAVQAMRLTPDRVSLGGVETPGDQEKRGEHSFVGVIVYSSDSEYVDRNKESRTLNQLMN